MRLSTVLLVGVLVGFCACCQITMSVRSNADGPTQIEVEIPAIGKRTERATLDKRGDWKRVKVSGEHCLGKAWIFRTFKQEHGKWVKAQEHPAKLDGQGKFLVEIDIFYRPNIVNRMGVF